MLSVKVGLSNFSSFDEFTGAAVLFTGWADCVWKERREIIFSQVGVPGGVVKEHPGAVQDSGAGVPPVSLCLLGAIILPRPPSVSSLKAKITSQESIDKTDDAMI